MQGSLLCIVHVALYIVFFILRIKRSSRCKTAYLSQVNRNDNSRNFVLLLKVKNRYYAIFVLSEYSAINVHCFDWQAYLMTAVTKAKYDNIHFLSTNNDSKGKMLFIDFLCTFLSVISFKYSKSVVYVLDTHYKYLEWFSILVNIIYFPLLTSIYWLKSISSVVSKVFNYASWKHKIFVRRLIKFSLNVNAWNINFYSSYSFLIKLDVSEKRIVQNFSLGCANI